MFNVIFHIRLKATECWARLKHKFVVQQKNFHNLKSIPEFLENWILNGNTVEEISQLWNKIFQKR